MAEKVKTEVGSYFVSNYPPYSFWNASFVEDAREILQKKPTVDTEAGIYIHVPFCRKRCKFCYFRVYTDKNKKQRDLYIDAVIEEIKLYQQSPILQNRPLNFLYMGGGTPSALNEEQIARLGHSLQELFPFADMQEITFECEPGTLTEKKIQAIKEFGVTRLSLGVENFSDEVLKENGRAHLSEEIYRAYEWIKKAQFPQINIDLIAGMVGETEENWRYCVEKTIEMQPESVTIYQMELPFNTVYAKDILEGGNSAVADWDTKRAWTQYAFDQLAQKGYKQGSAYTMVKSPQVKFVYRDALWHSGDMIGVGVSSFSHVQGVHYQNISNFDPYLEMAFKKEFPIQRAFVTTKRHRLIRELILQTKLGRVAKKRFWDKFQVDIFQEFDSVYSELEELGMLQRTEDQLLLTRKGLLHADWMLPKFYDTEYQNSRYT